MRGLVLAAIVLLAVGCNGGGESLRTATPTPTATAAAQLAFQDAEGAIWLVNLDGSDLRRLRPGPLDGENPSLSPDGDRIVFERDGEILVLDLEEEDQETNLTETSDRQESLPVWSPDGQKIAFLTEGEAGNGTLEVMKTDGSQRRVLAEEVTATSGMGSFAWSPDAKMLAFVAEHRMEGSSIYLIGADGTGLTHLIDPGPSFYSGLTWSPDGKSIAFHAQAAFVHATPAIMIVSADGSGLESSVESLGPGVNPAWSPNGKTILFYGIQPFLGAGRYCQHCLLVMDIDGPNPVIAARNVHSPADFRHGRKYLWSPDGQQIAFLKGETGILGNTGSLHVMSADRTGEKKLAELSVVSLLGMVRH
jgi:Tol biopolymer transport system component